MAQLTRLHARQARSSAVAETARAYDAAGRDYLTYADGDGAELFSFNSCYSFADREIWRRLDATLTHLAASGRRTVRLLDVGCGPGTWLRRMALRARQLGFVDVVAHGLDISPAMIALAEADAAMLADRPIRLSVSLDDVTQGLRYADNSFDITVCLYGVLNHLPVATHDHVAAELSRVTAERLFVTVRTVGSLPTIYVDALEHACAFHQDNKADRMDVDLVDGRHLAFTSHLFTGQDLRRVFEPYLAGSALVGLDVFHSRFASNPHWNPPAIADQDAFETDLDALEQRYASDPHFIDRAAHILLIGERGAAAPVGRAGRSRI